MGGSDLGWIDEPLFEGMMSKKWTRVACREASKGQAHSLHCGVRAAQAVGAEAVMVLLADQPFVPVELIDELLTVYQNEKTTVVASSYQGMLRPPILF